MQADYAVAVTAFWVGALAAVSLPLGALTSRFWVPEERTIAALMAFGGGALLAALSLDLVAPSVDHGHFVPVAVGAVFGGLIFVLLNELVNDYGGFMRKVSTQVYHLRRKQHQRYRSVLSRLEDLAIFGEVEGRDFRAVAAYIDVRQYVRNTHVYHSGDPTEGLFIVARGSVNLLDPHDELALIRRVHAGESFAKLPFVTGAPHDDLAVAAEDSEIWVLPREKFLHLLVSSPRLGQAMHSWLRSPEVREHLLSRQGLGADEADSWLDRAVNDLIRHATIPAATGIQRNIGRFLELAPVMRRTEWFNGLPEAELEAIAKRLIFKQHNKGETFFLDGDIADRLYLVEEGAVSLADRRDPTRKREAVGSASAFGVHAFLTGSRHATAAFAADETRYWVLLRRDLPDLLQEAPELRRRIVRFLHGDSISSYLSERHRLDPDRKKRWISTANSDLQADRPLTPLVSMLNDVKSHHGAALAIWLGILLDSIPESLVLGTIQAKGSVSLSLIAGLFISNYPEALSSSIGMKHQGFGFGRVLLMWSSLVLITGFGASMGVLLFGNADPGHFALIEGIAAGAMLTMIAQTMLPEAYMKGGNVTGLATLFGFLTALFFRELG